MIPQDLTQLVADRRKAGSHPASDAALLILLLMETEDYSNDYCNAFQLSLITYDVNPVDLEKELDRYI